jgi:small-conductance mechanosensitive channel
VLLAFFVLRLGDFLVIDNCMGSVEHIGIKSTRLRSLSAIILKIPQELEQPGIEFAYPTQRLILEWAAPRPVSEGMASGSLQRRSDVSVRNSRNPASVSADRVQPSLTR